MDEPVSENEMRSVPVSRVVPNPFQPRREFAASELEELRESIRQNGLLQPLVVRRTPGVEPRYQLVAGERRLRAVAALGWEEVSVVVRDVDDETLLVLALVENLQREALNALEEAEGYQVLTDRFGLTQEQIAAAVGKDRSTVANMLRLLKLPASLRKLLDAGQLATGHARALLALEDPLKASELGRRAAREGWSVREVERRVKKELGGSRRSTGPAHETTAGSARDPGIRELEQALQDRLGTRAHVRPGKGGSGILEIYYHSADDFERLVALITGRETSEILG
jgi:ParB family chromosome partitioning protein